MFELPKVFAAGTPRELGNSQGEAQKDRIQAFVAQRLSALSVYLEERGESARFAEFVAVGTACLEAAQRFDPDGVIEHAGIAEAAGIDSALLYAATNMTDVRDVLVLPSAADREGCTSLLLPPEKTRAHTIVAGQTWDLNPSDLDFVVAVHRRPNEGPETWSVTCAGALSLVGMNAEGVAVGTTNIKTRASRVGVGYLTILHRALRSRSLSEALQVIRSAPRAAAHTYWAVDKAAGSELECDPEAVRERPLEGAPIVQTNHCQAPELSRREGEPASLSSQRRLARAERVLALGGHDLDSVRALFADRSDGVDSINRYTEDEQGTTTNACIVCVPERLEMWACRGPSDRGLWQRLELGLAN
jgi:isopenicillin-N N-acyltransferase-like protein